MNDKKQIAKNKPELNAAMSRKNVLCGLLCAGTIIVAILYISLLVSSAFIDWFKPESLKDILYLQFVFSIPLALFALLFGWIIFKHLNQFGNKSAYKSFLSTFLALMFYIVMFGLLAYFSLSAFFSLESGRTVFSF